MPISKNVKPTCAGSLVKAKDLSFVFWFSSASPSADAYVGGKNSASGFIASVLGGHNAITSETEWPTVSWESIIAANPDVIVVASTDRNRWALDKAEEDQIPQKRSRRQPAGGGEKTISWSWTVRR